MAWWAWLLIAIAVLAVVPLAVSAKDISRYLRLRRM